MISGVLGVLVVVGLALGAASAPIQIGICKIVEHPALDAVEQGVIAALSLAGYEEGVDVEYRLASAQGDMSVATAIAQDYLGRGVDLVVAIATPMAQAVALAFEGTATPVVYGAVTDPVGAGLVPHATDPSGNGSVTGVSDMIPVKAHLELLRDVAAGVRRIGMVYNPGEANSAILTDMAIAAAGDLGLQIVTATADSSANVSLAAQSLVGRVDAYYVTTDNTVVSAIDAVLAASESAKVPFLMADPTSLPRATLAAGFDYYEHGLTVGDVVLQILGGKRPDEIPVTYQPRAEVHLNLDAAGRIGLVFPADIVEQASAILYSGITWERKNP
ncbi:MAG: ABC transporter substrate-binding protein [Candidatus Bipolaricaulota bacterium]